MKIESKTIKTGTLYRFHQVERAGIDDEKRTVELAFSSEEPYERFFGIEVLDHAPSSIRLGRLKDGGAVLLDHDPKRHIGVVEQVAIGDDRIGRAVVRFGRSAEADAAFKDVQDGIRRHVSVGYFVHRMVLEEEKDGKETYRVADWEPIEVSLVAIPADPTVGVGRSAEEPKVPTLVERRLPDETPEQTVKGIEVMNEPKKPEPADLEAARRDAILDLGEQYAKYVDQKDVADALRNGRTVDQFRDVIMSKMQTRHADTAALQIGMTAKEVQRYSLGRALLAATLGDWRNAGLERECSEALAKLTGRAPEGFYLPFDIFRRDFNVGTGSEAGNLVPTDLRGDMFLDALRARMVMAQLGVTILPGLTGDVDLPRKSSVTTVTMLSEIGSSTETNPLTAKVTLQPKRIGGYVEVSKKALIQSAIALEGMIREDLLMSAAVKLEDQSLNGNGTAPNIKGVRQYGTDLGGTVAAGTNAGTPTWGHVVSLETEVANQNAEPDRTAGYLVNTRTRGKLKQVQKGTNLPFIWENGPMPLNGYRALVTNNVPNNLTKGTSTTVCSAGYFSSDWSIGVLGLFGAPDVVVDPYSKADTGQVKIVLNQFADFALRDPKYFSIIEDWLTT